VAGQAAASGRAAAVCGAFSWAPPDDAETETETETDTETEAEASADAQGARSPQSLPPVDGWAPPLASPVRAFGALASAAVSSLFSPGGHALLLEELRPADGSGSEGGEREGSPEPRPASVFVGTPRRDERRLGEACRFALPRSASGRGEERREAAVKEAPAREVPAGAKALFSQPLPVRRSPSAPQAKRERG